MDSLIASYGSDDDDDHEEEPVSFAATPTLPAESEGPRKPSLFGKLPPPKNSASGASSEKSGSLFASLPPPQFEDVLKSEEGISRDSAAVGAVGKPRPGLFAKLPPPKVEEFGAGNGNDGSVISKSSLFAALPPPKAEFASSEVKVESLYGMTGRSNPKVKKQVVAFKPPIDVSILEDDDDDWRPAQKIAKAEPTSTAKGGGGLQSLLPAPKNNLGLGSSLGAGATPSGRRAVMEVTARTATQDVKTEPAAVDSRMSVQSATPADVKKEAHAFQAQVHYENSAYAVDESAAFVPQVQYSNEAYEWTAPQPQSMHTVNSYHENQNWQYTGNVSSCTSSSSQASYAPANSVPVIDPVAQVLQSERRRGREDKMAASTVIEVKQADLTGGKVREDQLRATGIAFGPSYQPVSSSKDKPSKIHRRKHQIGSLLHDMKAREMELLDRRAKGSLTKAETQAKYGW